MTLLERKKLSPIESVALEHGIEPEEVNAEIQNAISAAMSNTDPEISSIWNELCENGKAPTPDELTSIISALILKELCDMH